MTGQSCLIDNLLYHSKTEVHLRYIIWILLLFEHIYIVLFHCSPTGLISIHDISSAVKLPKLLEY